MQGLGSGSCAGEGGKTSGFAEESNWNGSPTYRARIGTFPTAYQSSEAEIQFVGRKPIAAGI